jgi:uncharacterized protein
MKTFEQATGVQRRAMSAELRTAGDEFALTGYAATFNSWSKNLGGFRELLMPGAFDRSLKGKPDVKCLFNHAPDNILGRTKSGTLVLSTDAKGLKFRCELNRGSQYHRDVYEAVKRGDIDECSFAFTVTKEGQSWEEGRDTETGEPIALRKLKDVDLIDVSVVTYPAYNQTSAGARAAGAAGKALETHGLKEALKIFRRAALAMAQELRGGVSQMDFASKMDFAHRCAELACQISNRCYDEMTDSDDEDSDDEVLRGAHRYANAGLNMACDSMATVRLRYGKKKADKAKILGRGR